LAGLSHRASPAGTRRTTTDPEVIMPLRHLRSSAAALLAAAAVPVALAACSSGATGTSSATSGPAPSAPPPAAPAPASPDANLLTGTQLKGLLEPDPSFPPGFT